MKSKIAMIFFILLLASPLVRAEVTSRDLQVTARALGFMENPFSGETLVGIVFDPANNRSRNQAEAIRDMMAGGLTSGSLRLVAELVPVTEMDAARVDMFFLTEYMDNLEINQHPQFLRLPCVTVDLDQVRNGVCALGIQSAPRVDIVVNREAAQASGIQFASVFRMMVREL